MKAILPILLLIALPSQAASVYLDSAPLIDALRAVYGEVARKPYIATSEALKHREPVSLDLRNIDTEKLVDQFEKLLKRQGMRVSKEQGIIWIDKAGANDNEILIYRPRYRSAGYLADIVQTLTGAQSLQSRNIKSPSSENKARKTQPQAGQNQQQQQQTENQNSALAQIDKTEVDQLAFAVKPDDLHKVKKLLADLDTPSGEVLLKAAVYEVGQTDNKGSAVSLVGALLSSKLGVSIGAPINGANTVSVKVSSLETVLSALDDDSRFRSVSRPQVRVKNGAKAMFTVGSEVPVLGQVQLDKNGNPVQSVEYRNSGVIFTATPQIREDTIEVDINQEISNFIETRNGVNGSPTLTKRAVSSKLFLNGKEVVIFGGLQSEDQAESSSHVPFIGWLLGEEKRKKSSEILVLIEAQRIRAIGKGTPLPTALYLAD